MTNKKVEIILEIRDLTMYAREILTERIKLVIHHVNNDLLEYLDFAMVKHNPGWIKFEAKVDMDEAFELYKLFSVLLDDKELETDDDYYHVYTNPRMFLKLNYEGYLKEKPDSDDEFLN